MSSSSQNRQPAAVQGGAGQTKTAADPNLNTNSHSIISSEGAIGSQFNPDGNIGQIGSKIGGPFDQDGVIGSQFDASKEGIAGKVEKMVGGPRKET